MIIQTENSVRNVEKQTNESRNNYTINLEENTEPYLVFVKYVYQYLRVKEKRNYVQRNVN